MPSLTITEAELTAFAAASHDMNPLHCDAAYARATPFGHRVVHGALVLLRALEHVPGCRRLSSLSVEFKSPVYAGAQCELELPAAGGDTAVVRVRQGRRVMLKATLRFGERDVPGFDAGEGAPPRREAAAGWPERFAGSWRPGPGFAAVAGNLTASWAAALMASSYVIGMELPGRQALFSRLELGLSPRDAQATAALACRAQTATFDERFSLLEVDVVFEGPAFMVTGQLQSFVRPAAVKLDPDQLTGLDGLLEGRTAAVIGGGRGLGAALAAGLSKAGAAVTSTSLSGGFDARDPAACARLRDEVLSRRRGLDLLVVSASPPILPLVLSDRAGAEVTGFVRDSLAMAANPVTAFLPALEEAGGAVLFLSSAYADAPQPEWAHYVAAKVAGEEFLRALVPAAPKVRFVAARVPRVLTDQTNALQRDEGLLAVEPVAVTLVKRLATAAPGFELFRPHT